MDSDDSDTDFSDFGPGTETCQFGHDQIDIPQELCLSGEIFSEVINLDTWEYELNDTQRKHLSKFLPKFSSNDEAEKEETVRQLLTGENFKFGNPCYTFFKRLKDGYYSPETIRYHSVFKKAMFREYKIQQHQYHARLLKDILVSRYKVLEQLESLSPGEKLKPICSKTPPPKERSLNYRVKQKYHRLMKEVRDACGNTDASSDDEEGYLFTAALKRRPNKTDSGDALNVYSTLDSPPSTSQTNGVISHEDRMPSPIDFNELDFQEILQKHKKLRMSGHDGPEMDTRGLNLQDITIRIHPNKRLAKQINLLSPGISPILPPPKKKMKIEKIKKKKMKVFKGKKVSLLSRFNPTVSQEDESAVMDIGDLKVESNIIRPPHIQQAHESYSSFFSLLKSLFTNYMVMKATTIKVEEEIREWQDSYAVKLNTWSHSHQNWVELVSPALKFLSGDIVGLEYENFVPIVDYKERAQQWKWIGYGRDDDEYLEELCDYWLQNKEDYLDHISNSSDRPIPPARVITDFHVRPSTQWEKSIFQEQEIKRFSRPHEAFTYQLHGYESVVGPVKGVYSKDGSVTKAREHTILVKDRPSFVTILTLVRDAAARLPNGEGTRGEICELLKDSSFISPGISDNQINTVVSGALDRLHYEKDPCVKYEVNKKLWIYLHRNRTESEFEKIHQAHGKAVKAKKALQKPPAKKSSVKKSNNKLEPSVTQPIAFQQATQSGTSPRGFLPPSIDLGNLSDQSLPAGQTTPTGLSPQKVVTFLQPHGRIAGKPYAMTSKPQAFGLKQSPGHLKSPTDQGQRIMITPSPGSSPVGTPTTSPRVPPTSPRVPSSPQTSVTPPGGKPMVARLIQQMAASSAAGKPSQVITVGSMGSIAASQKLDSSQSAHQIHGQISQSPNKPSQHIQNVHHPQMSGKPVSILSNFGGKPGSLQAQQAHQQSMIQQQIKQMQAGATDVGHRVITLTQQGGKPVQFISGGKPGSAIQVLSQAAQRAQSGKPLTMIARLPGKPFSMAAHGGKPIAMTIQDGKLVPVSMAPSGHYGGKSGKPVMLSGGKPMALPMGGKPINIGGKPIYLHQASNPAANIIRTSVSGGKPGTMIGQILQSGGAVVQRQKSTEAVPAPESLVPSSPRIMTQGTPSSIQTSSATPSQASHSIGGKPHNIQVVRKVVAQHGGKPSHTTYVISPPNQQQAPTGMSQTSPQSQGKQTKLVLSSPALPGTQSSSLVAQPKTPPSLGIQAVTSQQQSPQTTPLMAKPNIVVVQTTQANQ